MPSPIFARLRDTRLYPAWVLLFASVVFLFRLGSYGFWEPHEISVAERAHEIAHPEAGEKPAPVATGDDNAAQKPPPKKPERKQTRSELSAEIVAEAIRSAGRGESKSRGPIALLAILTVLATYFIGLRVAGPRAGLFSALILVSFPAVLMHGRHLTSEIASAAGTALIVLGFLGFLSRRGFGFRDPEKPYLFLYAVDIGLIAGGMLLTYHAAGLLLGMIPPLAGVGVAAIPFAFDKALQTRDRYRAQLAALLGVALALHAFSGFFRGTFDVVEPEELVPKARALPANAANQANAKPPEVPEGYAILGGKDLKIEPNYVPELAGIWRKNGDRRVGFSTVLEDIAIGTFPWIAVIPIAVIVLLIGRGNEQTAARSAIALWAVAAYVVASIFARKVGPAMYPALVALAAASGVWLSDLFGKVSKRDESAGLGALPLVAFFAVCAAVVVGKDILAFPEKLIGLNLAGAKLEFPKGVSEQFVWVAFGWAAMLALACAIAVRKAPMGDGKEILGGLKQAPKFQRPLVLIQGVYAVCRDVVRKHARTGFLAALMLTCVSALFFAQVLTPALSSKLSTKNILGVYKKLRKDGDVLGIMGKAGGASYYAGTDFERIKGRSQLLTFLERPERVFALASANERCPLNKSARRRGVPYYVVDDSSAQYLLFSNKLGEGEKDLNPLRTTFFKEPPPDIRKPLSWNLDDRLELVGVSMPDTVRKGSTFKMKLYFKVNKPLARKWKVFVHFDTGVRFQADHEPIGGTCSTTFWLTGDYVVDEFEVKAGSRTHPTGAYKVWVGLFVGSAGNYTNMKVVTKGADNNNRIPIGTIRLK